MIDKTTGSTPLKQAIDKENNKQWFCAGVIVGAAIMTIVIIIISLW